MAILDDNAGVARALAKLRGETPTGRVFKWDGTGTKPELVQDDAPAPCAASPGLMPVNLSAVAAEIRYLLEVAAARIMNAGVSPMVPLPDSVMREIAGVPIMADVPEVHVIPAPRFDDTPSYLAMPGCGDVVAVEWVYSPVTETYLPVKKTPQKS